MKTLQLLSLVVIALLLSAGQLFAQGMRRPQLRTHDGIIPETPQHGEELVRIIE